VGEHVSASDKPAISDGYISINGHELYVREVGAGHPLVVLHGGPDFNHNYLLPEMDRLADACRLIYYDQRGRGRSAAGVRPEDVSIESEMADLDHLRRHVRRTSVAVLGHSWGAILAMEYATRHPDNVSHLILMNTAPASGHEVERFRQVLRMSRPPGDVEMMRAISTSDRYQAGDLEARADYYRIHFRVTVPRPENLEQIVGRLQSDFTPSTVRTALAIEERLYEQTWTTADYDLIPRLQNLSVRALVLHGDQDFVPVEMAARIADAIPGARLAVLRGCGHFSFLEDPQQVHDQITALIDGR
jgi:proline iminopeptidase